MHDALDHLDLTMLPPEVHEQLRTAFAAQRDALEAERHARQRDRDALEADNAALAEANARLEYLVRELRRALYGKKSEKLPAGDRQLAFEDLETAVAEAEARAEAVLQAPRTDRRPAKRNLGHLPDHLPRIERLVEPASTDCPQGCGAMKRIGEDVTERLDVVPAKVRVVRTIRPKYACPACNEGVTQALAPCHLIEGGLPTEGLIAHVLVAKYADHCPLYRQVQILNRQGIDLDRSTLAGWVGKAAFHLTPIVERMAERLKASGKLFMDETRAPVLDPGRGKTKTGYLWALARDDRNWGGRDPPGVVYFYAPGRGGHFAESFLKGFSGILQTDGYAGYRRLREATREGGALTLAFCWAHARRKLNDVYQQDRSDIAAEGLRRIAQFYRIEAEIRGRTPERRLAVRRTRTAPLMDDFRLWLDEARARVSAKSRLGEKLAYIANHWQGLQRFLQDGRIEIDSNAVENLIRPLALNRKNALFAGHDAGGENWGRLASLIETAKLNGVDPEAYLNATLEALANAHPASQIDALLPWNFEPKSS